MMNVKIHNSYRDVVAICDSNLVGKTFEEGEFQLDVKENFYKGEEVNSEKLKDIISNMSREDATFNIVGENSTKEALNLGLISKESIKEIEGIPFSMVLL